MTTIRIPRSFANPSGSGVLTDGRCGICSEPVPTTNLNKFYCSDGCIGEAHSYYESLKPREPEEEW
jgi:hypothetical protein